MHHGLVLAASSRHNDNDDESDDKAFNANDDWICVGQQAQRFPVRSDLRRLSSFGRKDPHRLDYSVEQVLTWASELASALDVMSKAMPPVNHTDLAPRNVFLRRNEPNAPALSPLSPISSAANAAANALLEPLPPPPPSAFSMVLGDLGCSVYRHKAGVTGASTGPSFSAAHMPPEDEDQRDHKADMWAFGVCLYMMALKTPMDVDLPKTREFFMELATSQGVEARLAFDLLGKYQNEDGGASASVLKSCQVLAKVLTHTLWPTSGMRWSAEQVCDALSVPAAPKVSHPSDMGILTKYAWG